MSQPAGKIRSVLIAGPTASGKSGLALALAQATGGVVINADSMQVYDGLRILTARPSDADLALAEHRLYGHVPPDADYSVGAWAKDATAVLAELEAEGRMPIVCGGTGLYFKALLGGIDVMPEIPADIREACRARMAAEGPERLHAELTLRDPETASRLKPGDPQRITRALEILETTGRPLAELQRGTGRALLDGDTALKILMTPPRPVLRDNIARRFDAMLAEGALAEAEAFTAIPGAMAGTAGKAIGVAELAEHLDGLCSLDMAANRAVTRSRQYAKRQETWFRHQFDAEWLSVTEHLAAIQAHLIDRVKHR